MEHYQAVEKWVGAFEICAQLPSFSAMELSFKEKNLTFKFFYREKKYFFFQLNKDEKFFETKEEVLRNIKSVFNEYGELNKISINGYNGTQLDVYKKNK